jgi:hypothetical protein
VVDITPKPGTKLASGSKISARLAYTLGGLPPQECFISAHFDATQPKLTLNPPKAHTAPLTADSGAAVLTQDVGTVLRNKRIARPIRLRFFLRHRLEGGGTEVVSDTPPLEYPADAL